MAATHPEAVAFLFGARCPLSPVATLPADSFRQIVTCLDGKHDMPRGRLDIRNCHITAHRWHDFGEREDGVRVWTVVVDHVDDLLALHVMWDPDDDVYTRLRGRWRWCFGDWRPGVVDGPKYACRVLKKFIPWARCCWAPTHVMPPELVACLERLQKFPTAVCGEVGCMYSPASN